MLCTELLVIAAVVAMLLLIQPLATIAAAGVLGAIAGAYFLGIRHLLQGWGEMIVGLARERIQWTTQARAAVKEIKVSGSEEFVSRRFAGVNHTWARAKTLSSFVGESARPVLEVMVVLLVLLSGMALIRAGYRPSSLLGMLGVFGLAAVRLLPSLSRVTFNLGNLKLNAAALETLNRDIALFGTIGEEASDVDRGDIRFEREIRLKNVSYAYPDAPGLALESLDLTIPRGAAVAFVGRSGAGKTTVSNILIGLLTPTRGCILVDDLPIDCRRRAWRSRIGYIPQDIYLLDDTVRRNVAFGLEDDEIDEQLVWEALRLAAIEDTIKAMPAGLDTMLGERGVRLSGGQRQRIAIARALYHQPDILVLDEATSALDAATEAEVTRAVRALAGKRTVIVIAHRVSTVRDMDVLYYLDGGRLLACGSFAQLGRDSPQFQRVVLGLDPLPASATASE